MDSSTDLAAHVPWQENTLISGLPEFLLEQVTRCVSIRSFAPGEDIVRQGEVAGTVYLIEEGRVEVEVLAGPIDAVLATLGPGEHFGLMGVLDQAPRSATVRAVEPSIVAEIDFTALAALGEDQLTSVQSVLVANYLRYQNEALRRSNVRTVETLEQGLLESERLLRRVNQLLQDQNERLRAANEETVRVFLRSAGPAESPARTDAEGESGVTGREEGADGVVGWRQNALFEGLSDALLGRLDPMMKPVSLPAGEVIIREGDTGSEAFVLEQGEVEVYHETDGIRLATLGPGSHFGLMAVIDRAPRSATVRTITPTRLVSFSLDSMEHLPGLDRQSLYTALLANTLREQNANLRRSNERTLDALRRRLAESKARIGMGRFVTWTTLIICLYGFMLRATMEMATSTTVRTVIMVGFALLFALVTYVTLKRSGYPLADYGLTFRNFGPAVKEAMLWTAGFLFLATTAKAVMLQISPSLQGEPLFAFPYAKQASLGIGAILLDGVVYSIVAPMQEFVARSGLQGSLQKFLTGRFVNTRAVVVASVLFITTHLHISTSFAVLSLIPSLFWGAMFARKNSLPAVGLSHALVGLWFIYVIGFPGLE